MWRAFGQMPAALHATAEIAERCKFRLPLATRTVADQRTEPLGPGLLFGLEPARELGEQRLAKLVEQELHARLAATGRGKFAEDVMKRAREEVRTICEKGLADLLLFAHEVGQFCAQHAIPVAARGSATASLVVWSLGLSDLCPLDYDLDGRMFVHKGREDLPDLDLEVSSLHEQAVSAFVQQGGLRRPARSWRRRVPAPPRHSCRRPREHGSPSGDPRRRRRPRDGSASSQYGRASCPAPIQLGCHRERHDAPPELGIADAGAGIEPYNTLVRVAGRLEGLPHRYGAHPSAYAFSFYGPGALNWLPAQWVSAGTPGRRRAFGGARHLAVVAEERAQAATLAHQSPIASNVQSASWSIDSDGDAAAAGDLSDSGGPVLALQWSKVRCGGSRKKRRS
jgi:hypothetical protein